MGNVESFIQVFRVAGVSYAGWPNLQVHQGSNLSIFPYIFIWATFFINAISPSHLKRFQRLQNRAIRIILGKNRFDRTSLFVNSHLLLPLKTVVITDSSSSATVSVIINCILRIFRCGWVFKNRGWYLKKLRSLALLARAVTSLFYLTLDALLILLSFPFQPKLVPQGTPHLISVYLFST